MSDMKCPFCQQELREIYCYGIWVGLACKNVGCLETKSTLGNEALWQELTRTRKALEIAKTHLGYIKNNYNSWTPYRDEQMIAQASNCLAKISELEDGNL